MIVEGKEGRGSGSVLAIRGASFVVTNAHVLSQNPDVTFVTAGGKKIAVGSPAFAKDYDIARLTTKEKLVPLPVMVGVDRTVKIGDAIVIFGNSEGAGVFAPVEGKITGLGPRLIEFDAPIVPGNSGSPIIHVASGKVIGIASHIINRSAKTLLDTGSKLPAVRKFGQRLDSVTAWDERTDEQFETEWQSIRAMQRRTQDLITVHNMLLKGPPDGVGASRLAPPLNTLVANVAKSLKQAEARGDFRSGRIGSFFCPSQGGHARRHSCHR